MYACFYSFESFVYIEINVVFMFNVSNCMCFIVLSITVWMMEEQGTA
jgi:hypothetical protein